MRKGWICNTWLLNFSGSLDRYRIGGRPFATTEQRGAADGWVHLAPCFLNVAHSPTRSLEIARKNNPSTHPKPLNLCMLRNTHQVERNENHRSDGLIRMRQEAQQGTTADHSSSFHPFILRNIESQANPTGTHIPHNQTIPKTSQPKTATRNQAAFPVCVRGLGQSQRKV
ncbi:hypothetical protein APED_05525 [Acanthopleuribacter pedis]